MARTPRDVTEAELEVLEVLWANGPVSVRQAADVLNADAATPAHCATVQTLLTRLERKGFVRRRRTAATQLFLAAVDRDALIGQRLENIADELCGGSLAPLLTHLVKADRLSPEERQSLRDLIDELRGDDGEPPPRRPSR